MPKGLRPFFVEGTIAFIPLTRGYVAAIDAADVHLVQDYNWTALVQPGRVYAHRRVQVDGKRGIALLHRAIMNAPHGLDVDHIDGDGLNNRRSNLRLATRSQNQHNRKVSRANTSGFKGVSWRKDCRKWNAVIKLNGKNYNLGYFDTPEEAHAAYCTGSTRLHGAFGRTA